MRWAEIAVEATAASADAVTEILIDEGCGGTAGPAVTSDEQSAGSCS